MTVPASQMTAEDARVDILLVSIKLQLRVQKLRDQSASGPTGRTSYTDLQLTITKALARWAIAILVTGLNEHAQAMHRNPALDLVTSTEAAMAAAELLRQWIFDAVPRTGDSPHLWGIDLEGNMVEKTVSTSGASVFRTQADIFIATIG